MSVRQGSICVGVLLFGGVVFGNPVQQAIEEGSGLHVVSNVIEETVGPTGLKHPGCLQSAVEINALAVALAKNDPQRIAVWDSMLRNNRGQVGGSDWIPPIDLVGNNYGQPAKYTGAGLIRYVNDWIISRNPASETAAIEMLNRWAEVRSFEPDLDDDYGHHRLDSQWFGYLAHAADLLISSGTSWPKDQQDAFKKVMENILLPIANEDRAVRFNANWDLGATWAVMAIAVLLDDKELFDDQIEWLKHGETNARISYYLLTTGQNQESARDQTHAWMGLTFLSLAAQVAWTQGIDLYEYDHRSLGKAFEYSAAYNLGEENLPFQIYPCAVGSNSAHDYKTVLSEICRPTYFRVFDMVYHHYKNYRGTELPYCKKMLQEHTRPEEAGPNWSNHNTALYAGLDVSEDAELRGAGKADVDLAISPNYKGRVTFRLNAGGSHYGAKDGRAFTSRVVKGGGFIGGENKVFEEPIADSEDDPLYQSCRVGMSGYQIPLTNGAYWVSLHFSEPEFSMPTQRVFRVSVEDKPVFKRLDLAAIAGKNVARSKRFEVKLNDGVLNIDFDAYIGKPLISAIEVEPVMPHQKTKRRLRK